MSVDSLHDQTRATMEREEWARCMAPGVRKHIGQYACEAVASALGIDLTPTQLAAVLSAPSLVGGRAEDDTARLDWLERAKVRCGTWFSGDREGFPEGAFCDLPEGGMVARRPTLREAIDAARSTPAPSPREGTR